MLKIPGGYLKKVAILTLPLSLVAFLSWAGEEKSSSEKKVALVNGSELIQADLDREIFRIKQQLVRMGKPANESQLPKIKKDALENIIDHELLYQKSQKEAIKVEEAEVNKQLDTIKKQFPGENKFKEEMKKLNLTESALISKIKRGIFVQKFINNHFAKTITISPEETKAYYDKFPPLFKQPEQVKASHILIKVDQKADKLAKSKARKKIEEINNKLRKGEDFAALAIEHSQCPSSAKGGDLNYFKKGQMVKPFEKAAFALKLGEVSDIVETKFGYHLIKVTDKKAETTINYEEVKDKIGNFLKQSKLRKETKNYLSKLKEKVKIERFLN